MTIKIQIHSYDTCKSKVEDTKQLLNLSQYHGNNKQKPGHKAHVYYVRSKGPSCLKQFIFHDLILKSSFDDTITMLFTPKLVINIYNTDYVCI